MEYRVIILTLTALLCEVKAQLCVTPGVAPPVIANSPLATAPQVISTTIIDNTVSNALANALQLLIVNDILETKLGGSCLSNLLNLNLREAPSYPRVEVLQPTAEYITPFVPYAASVEIVSPCGPVKEPYPYLGAEIISPIVNPCFADIITPIGNYYNAEFLSPLNTYNGYEVEIISSNPFTPICGTEVVTIPPYNNGCFRGYNDLVTPIPYNSCGDNNPFNFRGVSEVVSPCGQYYGGIPEVLSPITPCNFGSAAEFVKNYNTFGGIPEIITPFNSGCGVPELIQQRPPYFGGFPEATSPIYKPGCAGIPELRPVNPFGPGLEIVTPCTNFPEVILPNLCNVGCSGCDFCGPANFAPNLRGVQEIVNPVGPYTPVAAEVFIPSSIPAQLTCNLAYSPSSGPCVNVNVEPLQLGPGFCL